MPAMSANNIATLLPSSRTKKKDKPKIQPIDALPVDLVLHEQDYAKRLAALVEAAKALGGLDKAFNALDLLETIANNIAPDHYKTTKEDNIRSLDAPWEI